MKSMTGYGRGEIKNVNRHFITEIKSTNSRYFDCKVVLPSGFNEMEYEINKLVKNVVKRGRVEIYIFMGEEDKENITIDANHELALTYYKSLKSLQQRLDLPDNIDLNMLLKFSQVIKERKIYTVASETKIILIDVVNKALIDFDNMRKNEGKAIYNDLLGIINVLKELIEKIEERIKVSIQDYKNNLTKKIKELTNNSSIDENRIALEVTLLAEKSDTSEEITKIRNFLEQFTDSCNTEGSIGRKLDFISQEISREINTIGAKSLCFEISKYAIDFKEELEKIREQVQNIE